MIGNMVETSVFAQWMHREWFTPWYARWNKGEVDLVALSESNLKPVWALEIKWTNRYFEKPKELKSLYKFCVEDRLGYPVVTIKDKEGEKKLNDLNVQCIPAASYAYTIGKRTLEYQKK